MPVVQGDGGSNTLTGGPADDTLIGGGGRDTLEGGGGFDTADFAGVVGDLAVNLAAGTEAGATDSSLLSIEAVDGAGGDDALTGDDGANRLDGRGGDDSLQGAGGDDTLAGGPGDDTLDGGEDRDTADYRSAAGAALINIADGSAEVGVSPDAPPAEVDVLSAIEDATGGAGNDTIIGDGGANALDGGDGFDDLVGGAGDDTLFAGQGADELSGGDGFDTANFSSSTLNLAVDLRAGTETATGSTLSGVEAVVGGSGADSLRGDANANRLDGGGGNDSVSGGAGADTLAGGAGADSLDGGEGNDSVSGGGGDDAVTGGAGADTLAGGAGADALDGGAGDDIVGFDAADLARGVSGGAGRDTAVVETADAVSLDLGATGFEAAVGNAGADSFTAGTALGVGLQGGGGNDALVGGTGSDALTGDAGADALSGGAGDDILAGGAGGDALVGGAGFDTAVFAGRRADFVLGSTKPFFMGDSIVLVDTRGGGEGADTVAGVESFVFSDGAVSVAELVRSQPRASGADPLPPVTVVGTAGDDRLALGAGGVVDGMGGRDWLDLTAEGSRGSTVTVLPDGTVQLAHGARMDTLVGVEEVRFLDGRVVFDPADPAAQVARLYEAALDRLPDQGGFNFWVGGLQEGQALSSLAAGFLASAEFQGRFGGATAADGAFVDRLYLNILGREGEAEGRAFWVDSLGKGVGRADVLAAFSESAENKAGTAAFVRTGVWDRSEEATEVARLYDTVLGRAPDAPGLAFWKSALEAESLTLAQVADQFTGGPEFQARYGALGNRDFANALYVNTLDRPAEQAGLDFWTGRLDAGAARSQVVLAFSESQEHIGLTAPAIQSEVPGEFGIVFA